MTRRKPRIKWLPAPSRPIFDPFAQSDPDCIDSLFEDVLKFRSVQNGSCFASEIICLFLLRCVLSLNWALHWSHICLTFLSSSCSRSSTQSTLGGVPKDHGRLLFGKYITMKTICIPHPPKNQKKTNLTSKIEMVPHVIGLTFDLQETEKDYLSYVY